MERNMDIRSAVRRLAGTERTPCALVCRTEAVDTERRVIDCAPLDGEAPLLDATLQAAVSLAEGVAAFPAPGSLVTCAPVSGGRAWTVIAMSEIDRVEAVKGGVSAVLDRDGVRIAKDGAVITADDNGVRIAKDGVTAEIGPDGITLNGGSLGGLPVTGPLTERLNAIENDINALKEAFASWTPSPQDGGAALKAAASGWAAGTLALTQRDGIENGKVTQ